MAIPLLICPGCRTGTPERLDLRTIERTGDVLACECGRRYPIVDGVPIVLQDPGTFLRSEIAAVVERDLPTEVAALLGDGGDDAAYARMLEHVSIYVDAHWGDRSDPPPDGPAGFALAPILERLTVLPRVEHAVELGCSAGRIVGELARTAEHVVGVDLQFATLRRARRLLAGEPVGYSRRAIGRHYTGATVTAGELATDRVTLVCTDALDPPLVPGDYDRVVALNVLDSVARPRGLLAVADGLCARGGELILTSPYAWKSAVMADTERIGGADPAADLVAILRSGTGLRTGYEIVDEAELAWNLRCDARCATLYWVHYVRARKL